MRSVSISQSRAGPGVTLIGRSTPSFSQVRTVLASGVAGRGRRVVGGVFARTRLRPGIDAQGLCGL